MNKKNHFEVQHITKKLNIYFLHKKENNSSYFVIKKVEVNSQVIEYYLRHNEINSY